MSTKARVYWLGAIVAGVCIAGWAAISWDLRHENLTRLVLYFCAAMAASGFKIRLPDVLGTLSVNYLFIIVSLFELQLESALLIGICSIFAQILIRPSRRLTWEQVVFSAFSIPIPIAAAWGVLQLRVITDIDPTYCLALISASMVYFFLNTWIVAIIIGLTTKRSSFHVWRENFIWTSPQYLLGGTMAGALHLVNRYLPWQGLLLSGPPLYLVYRSYSLYLGRVNQQQKYIADMADLHWRTLEALALAIEAKDETTAAHLKRVQVYAVEMAKELGLSREDVKAVEAAALLHDVGKLAVPEYIISKPGRLTSEEFDKMKIHPIVGAEILERVSFPYPVTPIVRSHHERYDGTGYPDGLKGEAIPIGARILAAVDCLDALASERQYRSAISIEEAMGVVAAESGKAFDPKIVELLRHCYKRFEVESRLVPASGSEHQAENRGARRRAGHHDGEEAVSTAPAVDQDAGYTVAIASARREAQMLVEITGDLGNSLSLDETLALLAVRLEYMVPYDAMVIYIEEDGKLVPKFVRGENHRLFESLEIPFGQGLSGWVVENDRAILNGNPAVEPGYLNDPQKITTLRSAICVPLPGQTGVIGALTLYHLLPEAFNNDHLRLMMAVSPKAGLAIENALRFERARFAAEKDELTGLLNAGSLFRLLAQELAEAAARKSSVAIIVMDLDGFKQANDVHGHLAGNRILKEIAMGLQSACRKTDHVARLGGDEFVLVLPDADANSIRAVLSRVHELGPEASIRTVETPLITISAGVATYPSDGMDPEGLLEKADQRMYEAKKATKGARSVAGLAEALAPHAAVTNVLTQ